MIIEYSDYVAWNKKIDSSELLNNFNTRQRKYLNALFKSDNFSKLHHKIEIVNDDFLESFTPFYINKISNKKNPHVVDIKNMVHLNSQKHPVYSLELYEDNIFIGGSIFTHRKHVITTSVKAYERDWHSFSNSVSPTLLAEYYFYTHAQKFMYTDVSHGKDRNPYGVNSNINLCASKLQLGYRPTVPKKAILKTLSTEELNQDTLVLVKPYTDEHISHAVLCTRDSDYATAYNYLLSQKSALQIEVISMPNNPQ